MSVLTDELDKLDRIIIDYGSSRALYSDVIQEIKLAICRCVLEANINDDLIVECDDILTHEDENV